MTLDTFGKTAKSDDVKTKLDNKISDTVTYSITLTDCEDPKTVCTGISKADAVAFLKSRPASRYSITEWDANDNITSQLNGLEWLESLRAV